MRTWIGPTLLATWSLAFVTAASAQAISITSPRANEQVPERPAVEGTVADPKATVMVVVHPTETSDYWVQPRPSKRDDGSWKVSVYIGRPGSVDVGKRFEVVAVSNPKQPLKEGDTLDTWPDAAARSAMIEIIRR
jgi:hypothetical protein